MPPRRIAAGPLTIPLFVSLVLGLAACDVPKGPDGARQGTIESPIIGGTATPVGVYPAVGILVSGENHICSGTLIAPNAVLTAGHCTIMENVWSFALVQDLNTADPAELHPGTPYTHPEYDPAVPPGLAHLNDIGVVILDEPYPGGTPVGVMMTPSEATALMVGDDVAIVGYGRLEAGTMSPRTKNDAMTTITAIGDWELILGGPGTPQGCSGDSGGPALRGDGAAQRVIGLMVRNDSVCDEGAKYTRVDPYVDWVESILAMPPTSSATGGGMGGTSAASTASSSSSTTGAGGSAPSPEDPSGCSCRIERASELGEIGPALFGLALLALRRRRLRVTA